MPDGGLTATNVTLQFLIKSAHGLQDSQLSDGPAWIHTAKYDVLAKPKEGASSPILPMVQAPLKHRFKLVVRPASKESRVYDLKLAKPDGKFGPFRASASYRR